MSTRTRLIELLASGDFRSSQWLGSQLSISRAAVWKHIRSLTSAGMEVHAVRGRGYRLGEAVEKAEELAATGGDIVYWAEPEPKRFEPH